VLVVVVVVVDVVDDDALVVVVVVAAAAVAVVAVHIHYWLSVDKLNSVNSNSSNIDQKPISPPDIKEACMKHACR